MRPKTYLIHFLMPGLTRHIQEVRIRSEDNGYDAPKQVLFKYADCDSEGNKQPSNLKATDHLVFH